MWVERTPPEIAQWHRRTAKEARTNALFIVGVVWLLTSIILAGGWLVAGRAMVVAQNSGENGPGFWARLPTFALGTLPFAFWFFRYMRRQELEKAEAMTICPDCDTAGSHNSGETCSCGGTIVALSSVKWIEDAEPGAGVITEGS